MSYFGIYIKEMFSISKEENHHNEYHDIKSALTNVLATRGKQLSVDPLSPPTH